MRLYRLDPRTKCEVYRAMMNGVHGRSAEDLIFNLSESKFQTRIHIKSIGLFYNSIDKAVATMNRSGISNASEKKEKHRQDSSSPFQNIPKRRCCRMNVLHDKSRHVPRGTCLLLCFFGFHVEHHRQIKIFSRYVLRGTFVTRHFYVPRGTFL